MRLFPVRTAAVALVLAVSALFVSAQPAAPTAPAPSAWERFVADFTNSYFAANPTFAVASGLHNFDGQLPDWSDTALRAEVARLRARRDEAVAFQDDTLNPDQRFERDYLISIIRRDLFWLQTADSPHRNPAFYADALDPDVYVSRNYAPLATRLVAYTRYAKAVPGALAQVKENLRGPLAKPLIEIGKIMIGGLAEFYATDVPKVFEAELKGSAATEFNSANAGAIKAVREFAEWLGQREKDATGEFALGRETFEAMIRETEGVTVSLAELEHIGQRDLERNHQALEAACALYAPGKSLQDALALAHSHKPQGSVMRVATEQLSELRTFVAAHDVVTIPGNEEAQVNEAPIYKRWNFAYINIPGPYESGLPSTYYVAPPDPSWPAAKQAAYVPSLGSLLFTSVHEVWPGHFLQFLHANRAPSKFGQVFVGYAFAEGWAHYSEEMMWDAGLGEGSPEMHIGQLEEALLRNARFLSAIGLHTQGMTLAESERLFREKAHQDEATAEEQARRGTFDPAYLNYTMGKLMIRKLREDWCASRGGRSAWKEFHDQFLRYGGPPIPLVRRAMLGQSDKGSLF
ncbi:MAG: DUF885 domain-containing protein [Opitutus sp.]